MGGVTDLVDQTTGQVLGTVDKTTGNVVNETTGEVLGTVDQKTGQVVQQVKSVIERA